MVQLSKGFYEYIYIYIYVYEDDLQLGKLKETVLLLKLYRELRKMFLSPRRESNPQPSGFYEVYKSKYEKVGVVPMALRQRETGFNEGTTLETLDFTIRIDSTPTFLYFYLYLYCAYAAYHVYFISRKHEESMKKAYCYE